MNKTIYFLSLLWILLISFSASSQVKIIFDTDFGGDADDLGALVMLHNFMDRGECEVIGIMIWSKEQYAIPAIDAVNRYYKHSNIPIGLRSGNSYYEPWHHNKVIADNFEQVLNDKNVSESTVLYRQLLSKSKDKSVVIVTVGPLKNIQELMLSEADTISELDGQELIGKKVKEFVVMGGKFPEGEKEWNFDGGMPGVTEFVFEHLKVPVTFSGFEIGVSIKTGEVFIDIDKNTPLYKGFMHFSKSAPWIKEYFKGKILDNSTYDQTAVLYAVRSGVGKYWQKVEDGYCQPDKTGGNKWIKGDKLNHSYLKLIVEPEKMAELIESIMLNDF
ncbi:MAG: nucleoside hydrolase [Bacteroidales bacterium]|nr:nucleoside hydrolase [Bacteroidales bacterium]